MSAETTGEGLWVLSLDLDVTRRKTFHVVLDPAGEIAFRSRYPSECMAWLANEGVMRYRIEPSEGRSLGLPRFDLTAVRD